MRWGNSFKNYVLAAGVGVLSLTSACSSISIKSTSPIIQYYQQAPDAVVLIDMQPYFLEALEPDEVERELPNLVQVVRYCAQQDIPIAILEQEHIPTETIDVLTREIEKVPRHKYITKPTSDGFYETQLSQQLNEWGATSIFLMGAHASRCVLDTAAGAWKRGIKTSTSNSVILNPAVFKDSNESVRAYIEMGLYHDDYRVFFPPVLKK